MKTLIKLHGQLGKFIGRDEWQLKVNSVKEAVHAIEILSGHKLYKYLIEKDKDGVKYQILINGRNFRAADKELLINNLDTIKNSELVAKFEDGKLETIDIIPIIQGAGGGDGGGLILTILGVILVIIGIIGSEFGLGFLIPIGIGLIAGGVIMLLSRPPKFDDFRDIQKSRQSYLFNGPYNTIEEGGPVPVGYGELLIGSQVIAASYDTVYDYAEPSLIDAEPLKNFFPGDLDPSFTIYVETRNYGYVSKPFADKLNDDVMYLTLFNI